MTRLTDQEARAIAIAAASVGLPVNALFFRSFFKFPSQRAEELEEIQEALTALEIQQLVRVIGVQHVPRVAW